jgi:HEAT repeat protein
MDEMAHFKDRSPSQKELGLIAEEILRGVTKSQDKISMIEFIKDNKLTGALRVLEMLFDDNDPWVRRTLPGVVLRLKARGMVRRAVRLLRDKDVNVRLHASGALVNYLASGEAGREVKIARDEIIKLLNDKNPDIRISAAWIFFWIDPKEALLLVKRRIEKEPLPGVRRGLKKIIEVIRRRFKI